MKKFYENLLACVFAGAGIFGISFIQNLRYPNKPSLPVYDFKLKQFIKRKKGVNETVLNSFGLEYKTRELLDYYKKVENEEQGLEFTPIKKVCKKSSISYLETIITMIDNLQTIGDVDNAVEVVEKHKRLKELLIRCNKIYENTEKDSIERVKKLYDVISKYIKPGGLTPNSVSIEDVINGKPSDCNDASPAYVALFNYYHVDGYIVFGEVKGEKTGLHAWIRVKTEKPGFELDPTWYRYFTPLDIRNEEIKGIDWLVLVKEDLRYKK